MCNLVRTTGRAAFVVVMVLAVTSGAQSSKPKTSTNNSPTTERHSKDEIADWVISRATFDSCPGGGCRSQFSTSISKSSDACTLHVTTRFLAPTDDPTDPNHLTSDSQEYQLPLASITPERIETGKYGVGNYLWPILFLYTTNEKETLNITTAVDNYFTHGQSVHLYTETTNKGVATFFVKDDEMAKRLINAFKDLIAQCGGKPSKKEIY
jgi:hypothetical protein